MPGEVQGYGNTVMNKQVRLALLFLRKAEDRQVVNHGRQVSMLLTALWQHPVQYLAHSMSLIKI